MHLNHSLCGASPTCCLSMSRCWQAPLHLQFAKREVLHLWVVLAARALAVPVLRQAFCDCVDASRFCLRGFRCLDHRLVRFMLHSMFTDRICMVVAANVVVFHNIILTSNGTGTRITVRPSCSDEDYCGQCGDECESGKRLTMLQLFRSRSLSGRFTMTVGISRSFHRQ